MPTPPATAAHLARAERCCPLWRRLCAVMYDLLIVLALMLVANMLGLAVTGGHLLDDRQHLRAAWFPLCEAACVGGYFVASWRRGGQTVGMRPWHIRVTAGDGGPAPLRQLLVRLLVAAAPLLRRVPRFGDVTLSPIEAKAAPGDCLEIRLAILGRLPQPIGFGEVWRGRAPGR